MIQYLMRYHYTRIASRRKSIIMLILSLCLIAKLALLTVPRDTGVEHKNNIERFNVACRGVQRRKSKPLASKSAARHKKWTPSIATVTPGAVSLT